MQDNCTQNHYYLLFLLLTDAAFLKCEPALSFCSISFFIHPIHCSLYVPGRECRDRADANTLPYTSSSSSFGVDFYKHIFKKVKPEYDVGL